MELRYWSGWWRVVRRFQAVGDGLGDGAGESGRSDIWADACGRLAGQAAATTE